MSGMRVAYRRLFGIRVRHDWYAAGDTRDDFALTPTASTAELLRQLGLGMRTAADGLVVFAEIEPDSAPPVMRRPLGTASLRFAFELRAENPALLNITELPPHRRARSVFCFDNLRADVVASRAHLGDSVAGARIGPPATLVTGALTYRLGAPSAAATVTIRNRFNAVVSEIEARPPAPAATVDEQRIDLAALGLAAGRYAISDTAGGSSSVYFDPDLARSRPLGIVEIFTRTDGLTPDGTDRVPPPYRFLAGDTITGPEAYYLQFQPVATTWRYIVAKKYANNGIALPELGITGPVAFTRVITGGLAVFTSSATVRLSAAPRALKLTRSAPQPREIRDLPDPGLATPLGAVPAVPNFVSDIYVYV
jgi:hypothetical protein